jgi:hypothetical protein
MESHSNRIDAIFCDISGKKFQVDWKLNATEKM